MNNWRNASPRAGAVQMDPAPFFQPPITCPPLISGRAPGAASHTTSESSGVSTSVSASRYTPSAILIVMVPRRPARRWARASSRAAAKLRMARPPATSIVCAHSAGASISRKTRPSIAASGPSMVARRAPRDKPAAAFPGIRRLEELLSRDSNGAVSPEYVSEPLKRRTYFQGHPLRPERKRWATSSYLFTARSAESAGGEPRELVA